MEHVACDLCGSFRHKFLYEMPDRRYFPEDFFRVVECQDCGLGFVNPRPSSNEMSRYYPSTYYEEECAQNYKHHLKRYAAQANYLRELEGRGGVRLLLDVGCANGDFPRFMIDRGWIVEGVEVSRSSKPIHDFKAYAQQFPNIPVNRPTYHAITAWAVLEHVHTPLAYFRKASTVINRNGLFVFLVPNFDSLASRHLFCEDVPRHLYFFNRKTIRRYLVLAGFRLERVDYGRKVFSTPPAHWLPFLIQSKIKQRPFSYHDLPLTRPEFIKLHGLKPGVISTLRFAAENPTKVLDRAFWPLIEAVQVLRKTYPVSTYVARKI